MILKYPQLDVNKPAFAKSESNRFWWTALIFACHGGNSSIVSRLVQLPRLDIMYQDEGGHTAAHWAIIKGHSECLRILAQTRKIDWNLENTDGFSALDFQFREQMGEYIEEDDAEDGMKHETAVKEE